MDPEQRRVAVVVSALAVLWMLLLATRFVFVPFDDAVREPPDDEVTLKIGFLDQVDSLNPRIGLTDASFFFYSLVYDCLTTVDEDMNPTGNLALSWWKVPATDSAMVASGEPYGSVWEYNLSRSTTWHDGVRFTADDVVFTLSNGYWRVDSVLGCHPYASFIRTAEMVDNYTVRIHFWNKATGEAIPVPWGDFIPIHILPKHMIEKLPLWRAYIPWSWTGTYSNDTSPGLPIVGTGPWMVTPDLWSEWVAGDYITLVRNPNYHWKTDKPGAPEIDIDRLALGFFSDSTSLVLALQNSELDVAKYPTTSYNAIKHDVQEGSHKNVTCFSGPSCAQGFVYLSFWMNASGPNDGRLDPAVRRAMAMAIDKSWIVHNIFMDLADPGTTVIPPSNEYWHYEPNSTEMIPFNATAAEQLLESRGYIDVDSDGVRECTVSSMAVQQNWVTEGTDLHFEVPVFRKNSPEGKDIAQYLKNMWHEIGVDASYYVVDYNLWPIMCPIQEDVSVSWWSSLDPDPQYMLFMQSDHALDGWSDTVWSDTGYSNSSYNESFDQSTSTLDLGLRKAFVDDCQRVLYDECPYIVLAYPYSCYAWRDDHYRGWGDWGNHTGRSLDARWGANPLFFDLEPVRTEVFYGSDSDGMSLALNVLMVIAAVGTAALVYFVWRRGPRLEPPAKTG